MNTGLQRVLSIQQRTKRVKYSSSMYGVLDNIKPDSLSGPHNQRQKINIYLL